MHLTDTKVSHEDGAWRVDFIGDDGESVSVKVTVKDMLSEGDAIDRARALMVQLTAFGTRGGGRSTNRYDAVSNGNFDDDEPVLDARH